MCSEQIPQAHVHELDSEQFSVHAQHTPIVQFAVRAQQFAVHARHTPVFQQARL